MKKSTLFSTLLLSCIFANAQVDLSHGLVAFYPFEGNADDSSLYANHALFVNGAVLSSDRNNNPNEAYSFDGFDDYIEIANQPQINFSGRETYAIALWIKPAIEQHSLGGARILYKWTGQTTVSYPYRLALNSQVHSRPNLLSYGQLAALDGNNVADYKYVMSTSHVNDDKWHHIVMQQTENGLMQIFLDGQIEGNIVSELNNNISNTCNLFLGSNHPSKFNTAPRPFTGCIDELRMYNRVLTFDEIKVLAENDSIHPIEPIYIEYIDTVQTFDTVQVHVVDTVTVYDTIQTVKLFITEVHVVGLEDFMTRNDIKVYPNPASEYFFIKNDRLEITELKIFNMEGEILYSRFPESREVKIDVNELEGVGTYLIILKTKEREITFKVLVR